MESIHKSNFRNWISTPVNVRKFRDDWCAVLPNNWNHKSFTDTLSIPESQEAKNACGLSSMKCHFQNKMEISRELIIPEGVDLETLRLQKEDLDKRKQETQYEQAVYSSARFHTYPPYKAPNYQMPPDDDNDDDDDNKNDGEQIKAPEVLLSIQIFRPEQKYNGYSRRMNPAKAPIFNVDQYFMVFGSQYLTELRDKIVCVSDQAIPGDYSDHPELPPEITCKDLYKSGYFYIDGIFYNDMRHPDCRDYSQQIIEWSEKKSRGIGPFKKALMEKTRFIDLNIQLGYPYVYVHQGNCEHMIVFCDLLMHTHHFSSNMKDYPAYLTLRHKKRVLCMVCHVHSAEWITFENKRVPETPFFFCKACFFHYNYDEHDQKIGKFRAYHHVDRSSIL